MATATEAGDGVGVMPEGGIGVVSIDRGGLYQVGQFLGFRDQDPREFNGKTYANCDVGLLVVGSVVAVQHQSRKSAEAAVHRAERGDLVAIPVEHKSGIDRNGRPYSFWVEPFGRAVDASEFGA